MSDYNQDEGLSLPSNHQQQALALWLQQLLQEPSLPDVPTSLPTPRFDSPVELLFQGNYHLHFYQQLPDFCMALLSNDPLAAVHYASLLYHLVSCHECHSAYLDLYDSLRTAVFPQGVRPILGQGTRTLDATPHRMLGHLCQTLISQAEALLLQARHDHSDANQPARALLQLTLQISAHIVQGTTRREALHDLVRVATLFDGAPASQSPDSDAYAYSPALPGSSKVRSGILRSSRRQPASQPPDAPAIQLRARNLDGLITQHGKMLELHLQDLDQLLQGRFLCINVPLGSLFEPVLWRGGNPRSIRSTSPVDPNGSLVTPLGETELQLSNPEERNMLEALFLLLQVRACDQDAG